MKYSKRFSAILLAIALTSCVANATPNKWQFLNNHFVQKPQNEMKTFGKRAARVTTWILKYAGATACATAGGALVYDNIKVEHAAAVAAPSGAAADPGQAGPTLSFDSFERYIPQAVKEANETAKDKVKDVARFLYSWTPGVKRLTECVGGKISYGSSCVYGKLPGRAQGFVDLLRDEKNLVKLLAVAGSTYLAWQLGKLVLGSPHWITTKIMNSKKKHIDQSAVLSFIENWRAGQHFEVYSPEDVQEYFDRLKTEYLSMPISAQKSFVTKMTPQVMEVMKAQIAINAQ